MWIIRFLSNLDLNFLLNFLAFLLIISISNKNDSSSNYLLDIVISCRVCVNINSHAVEICCIVCIVLHEFTVCTLIVTLCISQSDRSLLSKCLL